MMHTQTLYNFGYCKSAPEFHMAVKWKVNNHCPIKTIAQAIYLVIFLTPGKDVNWL